MRQPRRSFLKQTVGLLGSLSGSGLLLSPHGLRAAETKITPGLVRLRPEIEPLVRLIERTPRKKCFERMADQLRAGVSYRQFLAALFLAGIRNVNPQPPGFKFHCVFVIHSAHQLSLDAPVHERLLPLFWALDYFKAAQQQDVDKGDFHLGSVTGRLPPAERAWREFRAAMDDWDVPGADRAIVTLVRSRGAHEVIEGLWRYGARDYRNIGHKAIFVANSWRTLQTIGWQHAEPTLRSLVLGLLDYGKKERVNDYAYEDQCYLPNLERLRQAATKLPGDWTRPESGQGNKGPTEGVLHFVREGKTDEACQHAVSLLVSGKGRAASLWDGVHLAAGELMMRRPGIYGIHTVTSANALHYAFRSSGDNETRLLLLLQGIGWMSQFANFVSNDPEFGKTKITELSESEVASGADEGANEMLGGLGRDLVGTARQALAYARQHPEPDAFRRAAGRLVVSKGTDAHDYKYAAAIFEDYRLVSSPWRPHMLATAVYNLRGREEPDSKVVLQAREVLRSLKM